MKTTERLTFSPAFLRILYGIAALNFLVGAKRCLESFFTDQLYKKDFIQEYLLAKAILNGVNPYLPVPELARIWMSYSNYTELNHPTPHPPFIGLLCMPLALLSYEKAAIVWFLIEVGCLLAAVCMLINWMGRPLTRKRIALAFGFAFGWAPVLQDIWFGQLSTCLSLLLVGAWLALRSEKDGLGGALLGGMIAIKMMAWPLIVFLVLRRRWRGVISAGAVLLSTHLLAGAVAGFDFIIDYYGRVGSQLAVYYRGMDSNLSAWGWGLRLFAGAGDNFWSQPLWHSPTLARVCTAAIPMLILSVGLWVAWRAKQFDTSFAVLVLVANLISPIAWSHYSILASVPMILIACKLWRMGWPGSLTGVAFVLFLVLSVTQLSYAEIALWFATGATPAGMPVVPFAAGLLTLAPAFAWCGLIALVRRLDSITITVPRTGDFDAPTR